VLEAPTRIEPCLFESDVPAALTDLAVEIQAESASIGRNLNEDSLAELADLVRIMNSYYSNLIEGHNTRPRDIERALAGHEVEQDKRPLALEAKAHVDVQRAIDIAHRSGKLPVPVSAKFISWVHKCFYDEMPEEFRFAERKDGTKIPIVPGKFRSEPGDDVDVGWHQPPSSVVVASFMDYFEKRFSPAEARAGSRILAIPAAHHRFNYIHPFIDGNGRVSRLMSHAMVLRAGIGGGGLWSISRGLARGLAGRDEYKMAMNAADSPRRGDLDGRGNLSQTALIEFSEWFMKVMLDQIRFSKAVFKLDRIEERYKDLLVHLNLEPRAVDLVAAVFRMGQLERGEAASALRVPERTARNSVSKLTQMGFLKSETPKGALRIAFPIDYREKLFPNLFADAPIEAPAPPAHKFGP
jgi:Fic family protein